MKKIQMSEMEKMKATLKIGQKWLWEKKNGGKCVYEREKYKMRERNVENDIWRERQ